MAQKAANTGYAQKQTENGMLAANAGVPVRQERRQTMKPEMLKQIKARLAEHLSCGYLEECEPCEANRICEDHLAELIKEVERLDAQNADLQREVDRLKNEYDEGARYAFYELCKELYIPSRDIREAGLSIDETAEKLAERINQKIEQLRKERDAALKNQDRINFAIDYICYTAEKCKGENKT